MSFIDTYLDDSEATLTSHNYWLRRRSDQWELKLPTTAARPSAAAMAQRAEGLSRYEEITEDASIVAALQALYQRAPQSNPTLRDMQISLEERQRPVHQLHIDEVSERCSHMAAKQSWHCLASHTSLCLSFVLHRPIALHGISSRASLAHAHSSRSSTCAPLDARYNSTARPLPLLFPPLLPHLRPLLLLIVTPLLQSCWTKLTTCARPCTSVGRHCRRLPRSSADVSRGGGRDRSHGSFGERGSSRRREEKGRTERELGDAIRPLTLSSLCSCLFWFSLVAAAGSGHARGRATGERIRR